MVVGRFCSDAVLESEPGSVHADARRLANAVQPGVHVPRTGAGGVDKADEISLADYDNASGKDARYVRAGKFPQSMPRDTLDGLL